MASLDRMKETTPQHKHNEKQRMKGVDKKAGQKNRTQYLLISDHQLAQLITLQHNKLCRDYKSSLEQKKNTLKPKRKIGIFKPRQCQVGSQILGSSAHKFVAGRLQKLNYVPAKSEELSERR